jgi:acyl-CoA synthetase (AMP-forming)/AMP-acid ligase II
MIITGGFNVYPKEIEDVIGAHPSVGSVAVIGVADDKWGEAVKAVVTVRDGCSVEAAELIAMVREQKGPVAAPKTVDIVAELPLTHLGKPDKTLIRSWYVS